MPSLVHGQNYIALTYESAEVKQRVEQEHAYTIVDGGQPTDRHDVMWCGEKADRVRVKNPAVPHSLMNPNNASIGVISVFIGFKFGRMGHGG